MDEEGRDRRAKAAGSISHLHQGKAMASRDRLTPAPHSSLQGLTPMEEERREAKEMPPTGRQKMKS